MTYKYQLIFLGDINNNACNTIKVRFFDKIHSIGLRDNILAIILKQKFLKSFM